MLFQRLYNWIKYKTLPPSVLFKNRLFIERDSKHKRILNNFGLIFRNSKWTNHETYNIKVQFRLSFYKYILLFIVVFFLLLFFFNFKKYYICVYFFNSISLLFWLSIDVLDYYFSFIIWMLTVASSLFFNILYSYFFFNNFSENKNIKKIFSHKFFTNNSIVSESKNKSTSLSKHDLNWIFYFWLNNNSATNSSFLENIFENSFNKNIWKNYYDYFTKLYKLTYLCNLVSSSFSVYNKNLNTSSLLNEFFKGNRSLMLSYANSDYLQHHSSLLFYYSLKNYFLYFDKLNYRLQSEHSYLSNLKYDLFSIQSELRSYGILIKNKTGSFFFQDFSFENFSFLTSNYFEFLNLSFNVSNHINSAKWNRWLYRYSILHRKLIKNSHKITLVKRLVNSGFYNNGLFDKNIWASENFLKYQNNAYCLNSFFNTAYPSLSLNFFNWSSNNLQLKNNSHFLEFLNNYENSFFWFVKRFYFFNATPSNFIKNKGNVLNNFKKEITSDTHNLYLLSLNFLLKCSNETNGQFGNYNYYNFNFENPFINMHSKNNYLIKDFHLLFDDRTVLNRENLNILYWICSKTFVYPNSYFFDYTSYPSNKVNFGTFVTSAKFQNQDFFIENNLNFENDFSKFNSFF